MQTCFLYLPEILVPPMSKNATLGSIVTFFCDARGSESVTWKIDGVFPQDPSLDGRGIVEDIIASDPVTGIHNTTLIILTSVVNNGTRIQCRISSFSPTFTGDASSEVTLLIQGNTCTLVQGNIYHTSYNLYV